jgi:hypothetical protein
MIELVTLQICTGVLQRDGTDSLTLNKKPYRKKFQVKYVTAQSCPYNMPCRFNHFCVIQEDLKIL